MPRYKYTCDKCLKLLHKTLPYANSHDPIPCECGGNYKKDLATVQSPIIMVKVDKIQNVQQKHKLNKRIKERSKKFFMENRLDGFIEKIGISTAKKLGLIKKNGKKLSQDDIK